MKTFIIIFMKKSCVNLSQIIHKSKIIFTMYLKLMEYKKNNHIALSTLILKIQASLALRDFCFLTEPFLLF